jgi:glycine hydroxymethyltransferase
MDNEVRQFLNIVKAQENRKKLCINLIASENVISDATNKLQSSLLSNRYILDDFPNNKGLFAIQKKLDSLLCEIFGAKYVNTAPLSGMNCMELILSSIPKRGSNIYIINPDDGGHSATQEICKINDLKINFLPFNRKRNVLDIKETEKVFQINKPGLIYLDNTIICFYSDIKGLKAVAKKYDASLVYDGSHVLGLIAGKAFPNPLADGADILNGSTHKTFFGGQKGIILSNNKKLMDKINSLSKNYISSIHTGSTISLYLASLEMKKFGREYSAQIVKNARALSVSLCKEGVEIPTKNCGFTDTHQVWVDTGIMDPWKAFKKLADCNINVNPIRIPAIQKLGLRLGVAEVTRLGMKEKEMSIIGKFIADALNNKKKTEDIKTEVIKFCTKFQKIYFSMEEDIGDKLFIDNQYYKLHDLTADYTREYYKSSARDYVKNVFNKIPLFRGMIIRGGLGRGNVDEFSDVDFTCIFDGDVNVIKRKHELKSGMHRYNGIMFSGRYISLNEFFEKEWSIKMKHAYSYVDFIECDAEIKRIIKEKTNISEEEQLRRLVSNIIELGEICKIYDEYHGFKMFSEIYKQYKRWELLTANLEIDRALKYLKNIIFDLNKINYPEEKSYYTKFFSGLPIQPNNFDEKIEQIMKLPRDKDSLNGKIFLLTELSKEVLELCEKKIDLPKDIYEHLMNN